MTPLWLIAVCSLQFADPAWSYETSGIHLGLRQSAFIQQTTPDGWQIQSAATSSPWATDLLYSFPRSVTRNEKPFITLWIYVPTLPTNPNANGRYQYLGFRVTEIVEPNQMVWCGMFVSRDAIGPTLTFRPLAGSPSGDIPTGFHFNENEWLTVALTWTDTGALKTMAKSGKGEVSDVDTIAQDDGTIWNGSAWETNEIYIKHLVEVRGLFIDIAFTPALPMEEQPVFTLAKIETKAQIVPSLTISLNDSIPVEITVSGYPSESYFLQRSTDLDSWEAIGMLDNDHAFPDSVFSERQFYRVSQ